MIQEQSLPQRPSILNAWYLTFIVFLAYLVGQIDRQVLVMLAGEIKTALLFSDEQLGFLMGPGFSVTYALGAILFAQAAEYRGRKNVLIFGVILWSVATMACALVKSFEGLLVARLLVGLGEGALAPTALPLISASFIPQQRSFPLSLCMAGGSIGLIIAPVATGLVVQAIGDQQFGPYPLVGIVYGWQTAFLLAGSIGVVVGLLLATLKVERQSDGDETQPTTSIKEAYSHFGKHLKFYAAIFAAAPIGVAGGFALIAWVPSYLQRTFEFSAEQLGSQFGTSFLPSVVVAPFLAGWLGQIASRMTNRRGYFDLLLTLIVVGAVAMGSTMLMPTSLGVLITFSVTMVIQFVIMALGMISCQQLIMDSYRGHGTSILMGTQMLLGAGMGPFFVGVFATRIFGEQHLDMAVLLLIAMTTPVCIFLLLLARNYREELVRQGTFSASDDAATR